MILRVHQSLADGPALVAMLCRCLADTRVPSRPTSRRGHSMRFYCKLIRSCLFGPLTVSLWLLLSARDCNLLTRRDSRTGQMSVSWSAAITLAKVTRVKQVTRSTVNCVLLSALAGALRILLQSCGVRQPPDLRVVVPVDQRTSAASRSGSQVAPVVLSLPVGVEGAVPRLWSTRRALRTLCHSSDALIVYLATAALMTLLPSQSARRIISAFTEEKASLQFSSVVGPSAAVFVGGCPLKSVFSLLPAQTGLSVAVSVVTYADQLFIAVATDSSLGSAGTLILSYLQAQVELMYTQLKNRRVPGEVKTEVMYRFPDVSRSPVRELASRLSLVQGEVERLSRSRNECSSHETEKLLRLRAEFSHLLRELRKRKSLSEVDGWDVQWRMRRRAMSCSLSRRPSMSVLSLISTNRPASYIDAPSTSLLSPGGLCDEVLSTIDINKATSVHNTIFEPKNESDISALRDHLNSNFAHATISFKNRSNLRKYKSRTMSSIYDKSSLNHRWRRQFKGGSCNLVCDWPAHREYEIAIESLSDFATTIRRLSLENTRVDKLYSLDQTSLMHNQQFATDKSRRHSTIPLKAISFADNLPLLPTDHPV